MDKIIALLQHWQSYQGQGFPEDLSRFGVWLHYATLPNEEDDRTPGEVLQSDENSQIGYHLGELIGFTEHWTKLAFRDLPITGWTDFGILKAVEFGENPTKKEIAVQAIAEQSTIFEAIKRLQKNGLLDEIQDEEDKRVRRVKMTDKGKTIINNATRKAIHLSRLLVADLLPDEKSVLIKMLKKLNHFHREMYQEMPKENVIENYAL